MLVLETLIVSPVVSTAEVQKTLQEMVARSISNLAH